MIYEKMRDWRLLKFLLDYVDHFADTIAQFYKFMKLISFFETLKSILPLLILDRN